jgi:hypothetical protein
MEEIEEINGSGISQSTPIQSKRGTYVEQNDKYGHLQMVDSDEDQSMKEGLSPIVRQSASDAIDKGQT